MKYEEFKAEVRRLNLPRKHKVTGSLGVYDAYKWIRKNKWALTGERVTEHQFYTIIRIINKELAKSLALGSEIKFPHLLGVLEIRKNIPKIEIRDGKLVTNLPIDWDATVLLWYDDEESYENRTIVRAEPKEIFSIRYNKTRAKYNNKKFFKFYPNRILKRELAKNIKLDKIEAFLLSC